ncbi:NAD(P)-dependent oxidoreductase [bacterium]|nr:NAD(P)-dependent oxidoreductase [bacterium]
MDFKLLNKNLSEKDVLIEAQACLNCPKPSCVLGCPIQNNIPAFIKEVKMGNFLNAYKIISEKSLLPQICGALCPHEKQCQGHCIKMKLGKPVSIGKIERFVGEWAVENGLDRNIAKVKNNKDVLVVGSGPAGISFSYHMLKNGYSVTVVEKENYLGGVLKTGIPSFRFDNESLDKIIDSLKYLGCEFKLNTVFGKDITFDEALEKYSYVFLATGVKNPNKMNVPGLDLKGIVYADEFLKHINLSRCDENYHKNISGYGEHIIVVGGGNVAMDAARCATRLKDTKDVTIVYRRTENEMPACKAELDETKAENINFMPLTNPVRFIGDSKIDMVECAKMVLSDPDESGRRRPIESNDAHIYLKADTVVLALGYSNEIIFDGLDVDKWKGIIVDENNMTSIDRVYAGGDNVTGALTIVSAMKAGYNAAKSIIERDEKNE